MFLPPVHKQELNKPWNQTLYSYNDLNSFRDAHMWKKNTQEDLIIYI